MSDDGVRQQLGAIRARVDRDGEYTLASEELDLLCPGLLTIPEQFAEIAALARAEHWSFDFLADGAVHLGAYETYPGPRRSYAMAL